MNRKKEQLLSNLDLPRVQQIKGHKRRLRKALLLAHQECSGVWSFGYVLNDIVKTMSTLQKGFVFSVFALILAVVVGLAGIFGPSAFSVANAEAQESINRVYARLASFSDEERTELYKQAYGEGPKMAIRSESSLIDILAEAQAASDLKIVSADEVPIHGFFGRAGRAFGLKMMHRVEGSKKHMFLPEEVQEEMKERMVVVGEHKKPATFMVYTNSEGNTVYLGINENDEPIFVLVRNGDFSSEGGRMMIKSENRGTLKEGEQKFLKSEGDTLPGGEGKKLFNENGEPIVR